MCVAAAADGAWCPLGLTVHEMRSCEYIHDHLVFMIQALRLGGACKQARRFNTTANRRTCGSYVGSTATKAATLLRPRPVGPG